MKYFVRPLGDILMIRLLDASECVPTFSANYDDFRGFLQDGYRFLKNRHGEMVTANLL